MNESVPVAIRDQISRDLGVRPSFDVFAEIQRRVGFLAQQLVVTDRHALVLGVSGGIDSATAGRLCHLAVRRLRAGGRAATFVAVRLPYGSQRDEADAQRALRFVDADRVMTIDVRPASDRVLDALEASGLTFTDDRHRDRVRANVKARQRMVVQYAIADVSTGLVVGTDHAAEAVTGFFTKHGDGAADLAPLTGLTKRRVRAMAEALGASTALLTKVPTADLEDLAPGRPDEAALEVSYDDIDDFLEGRPVQPAAAHTILRHHRATEHKRRLPITPAPEEEP